MLKRNERKRCIEAIKAKMIPLAPPHLADYRDDGVNIGLQRAISVIKDIEKADHDAEQAMYASGWGLDPAR